MTDRNCNRGLNENESFLDRGISRGLSTPSISEVQSTGVEPVAKNNTNSFPNSQAEKPILQFANIWVNINQNKEPLGNFDEVLTAANVQSINKLLNKNTHIQSAMQIVLAAENCLWLLQNNMNLKLDNNLIQLIKKLNSLFNPSNKVVKNKSQLVLYCENKDANINIENIIIKISRLLPNVTIIGFLNAFFSLKNSNQSNRISQPKSTDLNQLVKDRLSVWALNGKLVKTN